jgi:diguanylate cyclase (GGDEF)-like protein
VLADTPLEQAVHVAEKLRRVTAEAPITIQKAGTPFSLEVTVSCGVASVERAESSIDRLMESADAALYEAKAKGRDSVVSRLDAL